MAIISLGPIIGNIVARTNVKLHENEKNPETVHNAKKKKAASTTLVTFLV